MTASLCGLYPAGNAAIATLPAAVAANLTTTHAVEQAFRRLMRARLILGMFDPPDSSPYGKIGATSLRTAEATALNRRAVRECVVMIKNAPGPVGKPLLPISLGTFKGALILQLQQPTSAASVVSLAASWLPVCCSSIAVSLRCCIAIMLTGWCCVTLAIGKKGSIVVAGPQADNAPNTLGNYDCGYLDELTPTPPGYEGCTNNHTSVVGGLRNGGTGLTCECLSERSTRRSSSLFSSDLFLLG